MTKKERYEILKKHYYDILVIDFDNDNEMGDFISAWQGTIDELGKEIEREEK